MAETRGYLLVVYDNKTLKKDLTPSWGFSCLINLPHCCTLFDTGGNASILFKNMDRMGIDPRKIDSVVLSHAHEDHVGGLSGLLQHHHDVTVYIPKTFSNRFKEDVLFMGARVKEVGGRMMIRLGMFTTGELGESIREQSLVLKTLNGLVIITGCAHPGIVAIVEQARKLHRDKVRLVLGGFHLSGSSPEKIRSIIQRLDDLKVERVAPCHCSGDTARDLFSHHFAENCIACGVGLALEIPVFADERKKFRYK